MEILNKLAENIEAGNAAETKNLTQKALEQGMMASEILNNGLIKGMNSIGVKFRNNEVFIPEVLVAARAMKGALEILRPLLGEGGADSKGKVVIGTVKGDLHDIGKNIVGIMLEGAGFEVIDLGTDTPVEKFVEAVKSHKPAVVGLSALLTTTMPSMKQVVEKLREENLRDAVKVIIGGAPVTQPFADEIGADGYSADATGAVDLAKALIN